MGVEMGDFWIVTAVAAVGTFLLRYSFILVMDMIAMPRAVTRMLRFIPAAVLTALVIPAVVFHKTAAGAAMDWRRMLAAGVAALVAWKTRSMPLTIVAGMAALWGVKYLMG